MSDSKLDLKAQNKTLGEAFFIDQRFEIPRYQRPYAWKAEQIEDFWSDLTTDDDTYFVGNIICNTSRLADDKVIEIIDGQQRILTITIFCAALIDILDELDSKKAEKFHQNDIYPEDSNGNNFWRITPGLSTFDYFRKYIQNKENDIMESNPQTIEEKLIKNNYNLLSKKLKGHISTSKDEAKKIEKLLKLRSKIRNLEVIHTSVGNEDTAYEVFETQNARGVDLSTADLLKNHIFRSIKAEDDRDIAKEIWIKIKNNVEGSNTDLKKFIRYFWISKYQFLTDSKLFKAIKNKIPADQMDPFITMLEDSSVRFNMIMQGSIQDFDNAIKSDYNINKIHESVQNLRFMGVSQSHVLLLSLLRNIDRIGRDPTNIFVLLEKFCFQYFFVCNQPGNNVEKLFSKYAILIQIAVDGEQIEVDDLTIANDSNLSKKIDTIFNSLKNKLVELRKTNVEGIFEENFLNIELRASEKSRKMIKYILNNINLYYKAPENIRSSKKKLNKFKFEEVTNFENIELEHILPRSPKLWGLSKEDVKSYVNKLGNFTIISGTVNGSAQNFTIDRKIEEYDKSDLKINKELISLIKTNDNKWNESIINDRHSNFAQLALIIWDL